MNNRGQIGKLISIFPMLFLIFIIMGIFLVLSAAFSIGKSSESPVFSENIILQDDLMFQKVRIDFSYEDKGVKEMMVIDALRYAFEKDSYDSRNAVSKGLLGLMNSENSYMFIFKGFDEVVSHRGSTAFLEGRDGKDITGITGDAVKFGIYENSGLIRRVSFMINEGGAQRRIYVDYYWGKKL